MVYEQETRQIVLLDKAELLVEPLANPPVDTAVASEGGLVAQLFLVAEGSMVVRRRVVRKLVVEVAGQVKG